MDMVWLNYQSHFGKMSWCPQGTCRSSGSFSARSLFTGVSNKLYVGRVVSKQEGRRSLVTTTIIMITMKEVHYTLVPWDFWKIARQLNSRSLCLNFFLKKKFIFITLIGRLPNCPERVSPTSPGESCCFNYLDQWSIFETYDDHTWPYLRRTLIMLCWADSTLRFVGGLGNATKEVSTKLLNVENYISSFFGQDTHK